MIPTIGVMIGFYIIARMIDLIFNREKAIIVKVFAVIAIIVDILCLVDLISSGSKMPNIPSFTKQLVVTTIPEQNFEFVGALSSMMSRHYNALTTRHGKVTKHRAEGSADQLGVVIPMDYKGEALPLWMGRLRLTGQVLANERTDSSAQNLCYD